MNWKIILRRSAAILGITMLTTFVMGFLLIRSRWFHYALVEKVIESGQAATGGKFEVQDLDFRFRPLTVSLSGVVLHGSEPPGSRPLLRVDRLTVTPTFDALLHRKIQLSELLIHHPVINLVLDADGQSNLPSPPPSKTKSTTTVWDLAVRHFLMDRGEIYYNDRKTPMEADLHELNTEIHYEPLVTRYTGSLAYRDGLLRYANYSPLPHSLRTEFSATPSGALIQSLQLTVGSSQLSLHGELASYQHPVVSAAYEILVHTQDLAALYPEVRPSGDLHIAGGLRYQDNANQTLLRCISADGNLMSNDLSAVSRQYQLGLRNLKTHYELREGNLGVHEVTADILGGRLDADLVLRNLDTTNEGTVRASLRQASVELARRSINRADVRQMPITGTIDAGVHGIWNGSVTNIRLHGDAVMKAAIWEAASKRHDPTPIDGTVHAEYEAPQNQLTLHETVFRIPSTSVVVNGRLGNHSDLQVRAIAGDLQQLTNLLSSLRSGNASPPAQDLSLSGSATLQASVIGPIQAPRITGQLSAQDLAVHGSQWRSVSLAIEAAPSELRINQGSFTSARQGDIHFDAQIQLRNWSYFPANRITGHVVAKKLSVAELEQLLNQQYPVTGDLSANLMISGSQVNPDGHGSIQLVHANAYNQPIQNLSLNFQTEGELIRSSLDLKLPAGSASAHLTYTPKTKAYSVDLQSPGIVLEKLQAVSVKNLPIAGTLTASAKGSGTIEHPQLELNLSIPTLDVHGTAFHGLKVQANVAEQRADLSLNSSLEQAFVRGHATVHLVGDYDTQATIDTSKLPLDPFLALYVPSIPSDFHSETELHATLDGPLKDSSRVQAHLTIPTLTGSYRSIQFENGGPICADYANSAIEVSPAEIRGTQTTLHIRGRVPLADTEAINLEANGTVNLALASMFSSDLRSSGAIDLDIRGAGTLHKPEVHGTVLVKDASLSTSTAPVSLSRVNGTLDVTSEKIQISNLTGEMGGGQISAGGSVTYSPSLQFNVALQAKSVRLLYPDGVRTVLDSNLTFSGNLQQATLRGRTLVDSLNFTPDFDVSSFAGQFGGPTVPPLSEGFADNIRLAVAVQSAQSLEARSSQLNISGSANLQVTGTVTNPVIIGRIDLTSGELFFLNNRYQLQRGIVTFDDPGQTRPTLNVQVTSTIQQYNLTLTLMGPLDRLNTNYVSDPSLPTADIISLVYRGQTVQQAAAVGTSTDSLLASQAASRVSGGLQRLTGISSLQIDPLIGGNNSNPSARIALQQRVTKNFLFTFSTDVTQPQSEIIQGEYQITKHWSVSAQRDQLGGVSVDGRYHTKF